MHRPNAGNCWIKSMSTWCCLVQFTMIVKHWLICTLQTPHRYLILILTCLDGVAIYAHTRDKTIINFVSMLLQMRDCFGCFFRLCGVTFLLLFLFRLQDYHMHHELGSQRIQLIHDLCTTHSHCDCVQLFVSLSCCCHSFFYDWHGHKVCSGTIWD